MQAIILAGGVGERLKSLIKDVPKPMAIVAEKPFLEYLILQLKRFRINDIIISTGHKGSMIKTYFGDGARWNVKITYSEEDIPLGTGGAFRKALEYCTAANVLLMNGDSFFDICLPDLITFHFERNAFASLALKEADDTGRFGKVRLNEQGEVVEFIEKGTRERGYINAGIYMFTKNIQNVIPAGNVSLEKEILPLLIKRGIFGRAFDGFFIDIGIPEDYLRICSESEKIIMATDSGTADFFSQ